MGSTLDVQPAPSHNVCPRCRMVNELGSVHCYSCGLPFDRHFPMPARAFESARPAGFWIRLVATLIDLAIFLGIDFLLGAIWPGIPLPGGEVQIAYLIFPKNANPLSVYLIVCIGMVVYYVVCVAVWSTTVGKRLLGIYVLTADCSKVGPGRALVRCLAYSLSTILFYWGFLMVGLTRDKRGLHDLICNTVVVKKASPDVIYEGISRRTTR